MKKNLIIATFFAIILCGCSNDEPQTPGQETPNGEVKLELNESETAISQKLSQFSLSFFKAANKQCREGENFVCSPLSASILLSTVGGLSGEELRNEICAAFGTKDMDELHAFGRKLATTLPYIDNTCKMGIFNSVWYDNAYTLSTEFSSMTEGDTGYEVFPVSFTGNTAKDAINSWVLRKSNGMIEYIYDNTSYPSPPAVLVNTLSFKGMWEDPFETSATHRATFHGSKHDSEVDMMNGRKTFGYVESLNYKAICIAMHMFEALFVLPKDGVDIDKLINSDETAKEMEELWTKPIFRPANMSLWLPKFELSQSEPLELNEILQDTGIKSFDEQDIRLFTERMKVSHALMQKCQVSIDEQGAEAAAVTWDNMYWALSPIEIADFHFDRPFFFIIRTKSDITLFAGKIMNY